MAFTVKLLDVLQAMEIPEEWQALLDPETGEIVTISDEELQHCEDEDLDLDELPDWQREAVLKARRALESDRMLRLPDKWEIHEWDIMRRFASSLDEPERGELLAAIHGRGAFRMFRMTTERLGLRDAWFAYRDETVKRIAKDWLEAHGIAYTEE